MDPLEEAATQRLSMGAQTPSQTRHVVAHAADLPPGSRKIVTVNGREIGVFHINDGFYALRNLCPHRSGPLCKGRLRPLVVSGRPEAATSFRHESIAYQREGEILKCPWHQWEFDIKTGQALYEPGLRVRTYTVVQEGNEIVLYV
jgi:3-phenylpropionate/trans-cinnamate dioxygenase ferredoxin subunit